MFTHCVVKNTEDYVVEAQGAATKMKVLGLRAGHFFPPLPEGKVGRRKVSPADVALEAVVARGSRTNLSS